MTSMNNWKTYRMLLPLYLLIALPILQVSAQARTTKEIISDMESLLAVIAEYDYDRSRSWLGDFQQTMQEIYNDRAAMAETEKMMIRLLQSDASLAGKQFVCKHLGTIATKESLPVLFQMLSEENTADMAIMALQTIPVETVNKELVEILPSANTKTKIAIINLLGICRDEKSITRLSTLIFDSDPKISEASLASLGKIGTPEAADILKKSSGSLEGMMKWQAIEAWLICADYLLEEKNINQAYEIYHTVFISDSPVMLRTAALRGLFKATTGDPVEFVIRHLREGDPEMQPAVISLVYELPANQNLDRIISEVPAMSEINQMYLFTAIADRGDASIHQTVIRAISHENSEIRKAGFKALAKIGNASDVLFLAEQAATLRGTERNLARECLYMLPGTDVDETIITGINHANPGIKVELIRSVGERNISSASGLLMTTAKDADGAVRIESLEALGKIALPENLPHLIELLINLNSERERRTAETAIYLVSLKMPEGSRRAEDIITILPGVQNVQAINSLISILGKIGDNRDLDIIRPFLESGDDELQLAAIRALSEWSNAAPKDDLKRVVENTGDIHKHTLALRGYIQVVGADQNLNENQKFIELHHAFDLASNIDEQKIVLSGLGKVISPEALRFTIGLLDNPDLKAETEAAMMRIADDLSWGHPQETLEELNKVLQITDNEELKRDIEELLKRIEK